MRTLIKLAVAALVLHGAWRVGSAYWTYYSFEDDLQGMAQFAGRGSDAELRDRVMVIARDHRIAVDSESVRVSRPPGQLVIEAAYTDQILILPLFPYPWQFRARARVWSTAAPD
jgi:hypothetical protein